MQSLAHRPVSAIPDQHGRIPPSPGMTLRQHYAGLAMQAIRSNSGHAAKLTAEMAVEYADALIEELSK